MQVYLLVNESCNLQCPFCIRGTAKGRNLIVAEWKRVLDLNDFSHDTLLVTGGEPSLHLSLPEIIRCSFNKFNSICVHTNGTESDWIANVHDRNVAVQISVDGSRELHNAIRGRGRIDVCARVEKTVGRLNSRNIRYCVSTTINKTNVSDVGEMVKYISTFPRLDYWKVAPQLPFGCGKIEDCLTVAEWNEIVDRLHRDVEIPLRAYKLFDFRLVDAYVKEHGELPPRAMNCGNVTAKVYIYPDLTVYPCTCLTDFPLGNALTCSLKEILHGEKAMLFRDYKVAPESYCSSCRYLPFCNGGCIGMSYATFGRLGMGDARCPLMNR